MFAGAANLVYMFATIIIHPFVMKGKELTLEEMEKEKRKEDENVHTSDSEDEDTK